MRMLSQKKSDNKMKKSHLLLFGSLLIFFGISMLSFNYFMKIRDLVFSEMKIAMTEDNTNLNEEIVNNIPEVNNLSAQPGEEKTTNVYQEIDYSKYFGVLEIPKIGLKRGFYNIDSKYNTIQYNVTLVKGSTMPDVVNGNLILMAHSGDAYISYFAYLYKLVIGDYAYVTYNGQKYTYQIKNIYNVVKNGIVSIRRNYDKTSLTLITCTKNSDSLQTVYIAELV